MRTRAALPQVRCPPIHSETKKVPSVAGSVKVVSQRTTRPHANPASQFSGCPKSRSAARARAIRALAVKAGELLLGPLSR